MKHWLWLGGWGLSVAWQKQQVEQAWPGIQHTVLYPGMGSLEMLKKLSQTQGVDRLLGYSLGAFLILKAWGTLGPVPVVLLAPILDFKLEQDCGGRMPSKRLTLLLRWLRRDPVAALNDFYRQAGIRCIIDNDHLPYSLNCLTWGIERLRDDSVMLPPPRDVRAVVGERDALLDAERLQNIWSGLEVRTQAGHDFSELLKGISTT